MANLGIIVSRVEVVEAGLILLLTGEEMVGERFADLPLVRAECVVASLRLAGAVAAVGGRDRAAGLASSGNHPNRLEPVSRSRRRFQPLPPSRVGLLGGLP